jgi:hypothetical protein
MTPPRQADHEDPAEPADHDVNVHEDVWPFPSEKFLHEWAPGVLQAQNAWMSSIDSLRAPDRKTHSSSAWSAR